MADEPTALEKAKACMARIAEDGEYDAKSVHHMALMDIARTQAIIAQAEALERIVHLLTPSLTPPVVMHTFPQQTYPGGPRYGTTTP